MTIEGYSDKGEWPINWRIFTFPRDACLVLKIRQAAEELRKENSITGPVADLVAEDELMKQNPHFREVSHQVNQKITFGLPTPLLRLLSLFDFSETYAQF